MGERYAPIEKRWAYALLALALFAGSFLAIVVFKSPTRVPVSFAAENEQADSNKPGDANEGPEEEQEGAKEKKALRPDHNHPAFAERVMERARMVQQDIKERGVGNRAVLDAMRMVPRHAFVPPGHFRRAYRDHPLPIGLNQTISQPYIVAYMTEFLELRPDSKVFEVGTGSGYQAAVCAEIAREVYTVEILEKLAESAKARLKELGYRNVTVKSGDGYYGWKEKGPFDAIIITAAAGLVPPPLIEQLKPGGRMVLPQGSPYGSQWLVLITKDDKGKVRSKRLLPVQFVPMTGRIMEPVQPPEK